jgi:DNA repair protein RadD
MLDPRYYQRDALSSLYEYWRTNSGTGLIVLPTGSGKAFVIAKLIEELLADYPDLRIANIMNSSTLVGQNYTEFMGLCPFAPAGIYSAGLGRRDAHAQVLFGGIQSVYNKTDLIGPIDLCLIDEAHAISRRADTQYGEFFAGLRRLNPDVRICGFTATDYRMDSGRMTEGDDRLFDDIVYEIGIGELIEKGYLSPLSSKSGSVSIDLTGVKKSGGDFIAGELERAADKDEITEAAVAEAIQRGHNRRAALFFCSGQDHSDHVRDEIRRQGRTAESLTSRTPDKKRILDAFKAGEVWALASTNMLTTGFNVPHVDLISMLRPTASTGLYVQICGRGTRLAPGKTDCLILDHSGNVKRHGPVDMVRPRTPGKGDGEPPQKICPPDVADANGNFGCEEILLISVMKCACCGYEFPPNEEEKITAAPDDAPVLSTEKPWYQVDSRTFRHHPGKLGPDGEAKPDSVKATYMISYNARNEWLCCEHTGYAKSKAQRYWADHGGSRPFPATVLQWLERQHELAPTVEVQLDFSKNPKYPEIMARRVGVHAANDNRATAANDNLRTNIDWEMDDAIPF